MEWCNPRRASHIKEYLAVYRMNMYLNVYILRFLSGVLYSEKFPPEMREQNKFGFSCLNVFFVFSLSLIISIHYQWLVNG